MLRKALSLKRFPYKSGCACSEKWGRPSTFALLFTRLGGHAPKSWTAAGLARAFFIRFYRFLGGYTPKKHWIFSRETGWSCSEFCIETVRMRPSGIFSVNQQIDNDLIILPIEQMRKLLGYEEEVSGVELRLVEGSTAKDLRSAIKDIQKELGPGFKVLDRFRQNTSLYKMMRYEKAAIFLILIFVIIIIALNIFGSITMLIIEKKDDIETYRSLGATDKMLRHTFTLEGWLISLLGLAAGLVVGIGFSLAQQHFGFIKMPGSFLVNAYPVILQWQDVLATIAGVALIGYIIALLPVRRNIR